MTDKRYRDGWKRIRLLLCTLLLGVSRLVLASIEDSSMRISSSIEPFPTNEPEVFAATTREGNELAGQQHASVDSRVGESSPSSPSDPVAVAAFAKPPISRVWAPIPPHVAEDTLPPLFHFDGTHIHSVSSDESSPSSSSLSLPPRTGSVTSFTTLVLRLNHRVTSVGMWRPEFEFNTVGPSRSTQAARRRESEARQDQGEAIKPPLIGPTAVTSTFNLAVTTVYRERAGIDVYRGLHLHVLPGPSFQRGSMSAISTAFGSDAIGFEQSFHSAHDHRIIDDTNDLAKGEKLSFKPDSSPELSATHLPGYGPMLQLRTMSGQHNENWIMYVTGHYNETLGKIEPRTAIHMLQSHVWYDSTLVKEHMSGYESYAADPTLYPPPDTTPSMNALGCRIRLSSDFTIRPAEFGKSLMSPLDQGNSKQSSTTLDDDADFNKLISPPSADENDSTPTYARIVDFRAYQQRKFLFIGVAYDDGFIRIYARNGTLRNEIHTRNSTILLIAMSNWGTSIATPANGGGARESNHGLNGAQNGNQLLAYTTPEGIGLIKMARIHSEIDQFCKWTGGESRITNGHQISALSFDSASQSVLYIASVDSSAIYVLHTRLTWGGSIEYGEGGHRIIREGGNPCQFAAEIMVRLDPVPPSTRRTFELLSLRGVLFLSTQANSGGESTLIAYNTSTINNIPKSAGVEFMFERRLKGHDGASDRLESIHIEQIVADRIQMLLVGGITDCRDGCFYSSPMSTPIHVFQLFLPTPESTSISSWLNFSRTPFLMIGLIFVLGYQMYQKRKRSHSQSRFEEFDENELRRLAQGGSMSNELSGKGRQGLTPDELAMVRRMGIGVGSSQADRFAASNNDPFDNDAFMADFQRWQQSRSSGANSGGDRYLDLLSHERQRFHSGASAKGRSSSHRQSRINPTRSAQRAQQRNELKQMIENLDSLKHSQSSSADAGALSNPRTYLTDDYYVESTDQYNGESYDSEDQAEHNFENDDHDAAYDDYQCDPSQYDQSDQLHNTHYPSLSTYPIDSFIDEGDETGDTNAEYSDYDAEDEGFVEEQAGNEELSYHPALEHYYPLLEPTFDEDGNHADSDSANESVDEELDTSAPLSHLHPHPSKKYDDLVNDEADAVSGEGWIHEEEVEHQACQQSTATRRPQHNQQKPSI